ncbi:MAG TPA: hypothetical protein VHS09_10565, partial [Polyangiaceae bacterium]|nr:hypothetical protein [Polyangiaceae bacterium]
TCLYLYVEPRGRRQWAAAGDSPATRRAPLLLRFTAWLSFVVGQLAIPWLLVPAACAALVFRQAKLGVARPLGLGVTVAVGVAALLQSLLSLRLIPLGVRLLSRDGKTAKRAGGGARWNGMLSAVVLGGCLLLSWAIAAVPGFVHPWLRVALVWTALRPVMIYAALCLGHALLLGRCARALAADRN